MIMKKFITILLITLASVMASAQDNTAVGKIFNDPSHKNENSTETIITGKALKGSGLSLYRSLVIKDCPELADKISKAATTDGANAISREVIYIDGKIYYAQFMLKPIGDSNRYIFYINTHLKNSNKIMLMYMQGTAGPDEIKKLIKKQ